MSVTTVTTPPPPSLPTPGAPVPGPIAGPTTEIGKPAVVLGMAPEALKGPVTGQIEPGFVPPLAGTASTMVAPDAIRMPFGQGIHDIQANVQWRKPSPWGAVGIGAAIGAVAGAVLPFVPMWLGAAAGAGIGYLVHSMQNHQLQPHIPGYGASDGWVPVGRAPGYGGAPIGFPGGYPGALPTFPGAGYPGGFPGVPIPMNGGIAAGLPGYGGLPLGGVPYGGMPYGGLMGGVLGMQGATGAANPATGAALAGTAGLAGAAGVAAAVPGTKPPTDAPAPAAATVAKKTPKHPGAKTWVDGDGNVRQVGTGKVLKHAK